MEHARYIVAQASPSETHAAGQWLWEHGPTIVCIVVGMVLLLGAVRFIDGRIAKFLTGRGDPAGLEERNRRARTLESSFHHVATVVVVVGGLLMILAEVGVNITPLLGSAAVVGLATAFAAQTLIRDYFYGFLILLENQYGINDEVKIASIAGRVERITLRLTVLRDPDGVQHFIPNGQITTVSNLSRKRP